ncbi:MULTISPECIES: HupE/UreJ family protein [Mesorhizobium]|uniref:HupE/UreJ family protein n=1 Tax=Mesorhizobium TaxID=68287 RepID=UPI0003CF3D7D|nr:HupE/UreJ family protein [Mesorhizobium sp. LNHC229A00]ESY90247.1 protein hupE [Mesorhizobium sp. LNHC229A00]
MRLIATWIALTLTFIVPASAHPSIGSAVSFAAGVAHPLSGLDHITAMVAVGLWAAVKGRRALWVWPLTFVTVMLVGGVLGLARIALPFVEPGILASVVVLGLMVALAVDPPVWAGAAIIGFFALLHGYAHGAEVAPSANGLEYVAGFALATAMLHAVGIGFGLTLQRVTPGPVNRIAGVICVAVGAGLCAGAL